MVFWLAVAVGGIFAWVGVQIGFYATWILFFHLLLAAYAAIFLTPVIIANVPAATTTDYGYAMIFMCVAVATLCIAYGICFACLTGHLRVEFPKIFDGIGAGLLGFQAGFLVLSFLSFTFCLTPLAQNDFAKKLRLDAPAQKSNIAFLCWWCDRVHGLVSRPGDQPSSGKEVADLLVKVAAPVKDPSGSDAGGAAEKSAPLPPPASSIAGTAEPAANQTAGPAKENAPPGTAEHPAAAPNETGSPAATTVPPPAHPGQSLDQELAQRRVIVHTAADLDAALARQQVQIIEVADDCTVDKLDSPRGERLQRWVSEGGILWVNNDVLTLFGVQHSRLASGGGDLYCRVSDKAEVSSILADCKKVALKDVGGKAHALASRGVMPLLALESDVSLKDLAGTTCWSLVPYGKGWISDPKSVDLTQFDGAQFWRNFCGFCLKKETHDAQAGPPARAEEKLSGVWQASAGGRFLIDDEGEKVAVDLVSSDTIRVLTGKLIRHDQSTDPKSLAGIFDVVFAADAPKKYTVDVILTVSDANHLRLRYANWPQWNVRGEFIGRGAVTESWTRSDSIFGKPAEGKSP